jgi:transposase
MKLVIIALALAATNALHIVDQTPVMTIVEHHSAMFDAPQEGPYDKCFHYLEDILHHIKDLVQLIHDHHYDRIPQKVLKIASLVQLAVDCFTHPENLALALGLDPQCVIDHLKKAGVKAQEIVYDVTHRRFDEAKVHIRELLDILRSIKTDCK